MWDTYTSEPSKIASMVAAWTSVQNSKGMFTNKLLSSLLRQTKSEKHVVERPVGEDGLEESICEVFAIGKGVRWIVFTQGTLREDPAILDSSCLGRVVVEERSFPPRGRRYDRF